MVVREERKQCGSGEALWFVNSFVQIQLRCKLCPFIYKNASYFELSQCVFIVQELETDFGTITSPNKTG